MADIPPPVPLFLLSPPRSGSTLLQRMVATHPDISTVSEPWILLPLAELVRNDLSVARYDRHLATRGVSEFLGAVDDAGPDEFIRRVALDAYGSAAPGAMYFLDKTPRYYLLADWLPVVFPESRSIALVRNPLAVAASIIGTWGGGRWNLFLYRVDLYTGMERLADIAATKRFPVFRYEDLVADPDGTLTAVLEAFGVEGGADVSSFGSVELKGSMGDPTGGARFGGTVSESSASSWSTAFANPLRRIWALVYLRRLGRARLAALGYDYDMLRRETLAAPWSFDHLISDVALMAGGSVYVAIAELLPSKARGIFDWLWERRSSFRGDR